MTTTDRHLTVEDRFPNRADQDIQLVLITGQQVKRAEVELLAVFLCVISLKTSMVRRRQDEGCFDGRLVSVGSDHITIDVNIGKGRVN